MKFKFLFLLVALWPMLAQGEKIVVLSDIHVSPGNSCDSAMRAVIKEVNATPCDLVVVCGDLTRYGRDAELRNVAQVLKGIRHPLYVLPGNHEDCWSPSATKTYNELFGADRFSVGLDSLALVGINCGPYMKMGDGHVKQEDLAWLEKELEKYTAQGKRILSFNHYPVRDKELDNAGYYGALLSRYPVLAHINGHCHRWIPYMIGDIEGIMLRNLDKGLKGDFGYSILDVEPDGLSVYDKPLGGTPKLIKKLAYRKNVVPVEYKPFAPVDTLLPSGHRVKEIHRDAASIFTRMDVDKKNVYFGTSTGIAKAIAKDSGRLRWQIEMQGGMSLFSRPVRLAGKNLALPYSEGIRIVDAGSGKFLKEWKDASNPYVADGVVAGGYYLQGGREGFECRSAKDGRLIWRYDSIKEYCQGMPALKDGQIVFGAWDNTLRSLDAKTGKLQWSWNNKKGNSVLKSPANTVPAITDDKVAVVSCDRYLTLFDRATGRELWRDTSRKFRESMGLSADGYTAYFKTMDGELVAVDTRKPAYNEAWVLDMGIGYDHAPCPIIERNGIIYVGSRRGILTAVDAEKHSLLWSVKVGTSEINGIEADPESDDLYLSLVEGIVCRVSAPKK